jgi:hypothetical protein
MSLRRWSMPTKFAGHEIKYWERWGEEIPYIVVDGEEILLERAMSGEYRLDFSGSRRVCKLSGNICEDQLSCPLLMYSPSTIASTATNPHTGGSLMHCRHGDLSWYSHEASMEKFPCECARIMYKAGVDISDIENPPASLITAFAALGC